LIWLSVWFFFLTNWVSQDYFAPQALAYFFHLIILGICFKWLKVMEPRSLSLSVVKRWLIVHKMISVFQSFIGRPREENIPVNIYRSRERVALLLLLILLFAIIIFSHQLTPFMTIIAVTTLVILQRCTTRTLPLLMIVLEVIWLGYGAVAFMGSNIAGIVASVGQILNNVDSNLVNLSQVSSGQRFVAVMGRGLTIFLWGLAFLGSIRRLRHSYWNWDLPYIFLALIPFTLLIGNSYGGEIVFRVYLFALPFMAFFAAALLYPSPISGTSWRTMVMTMLISSMMLTGFSFAHYGKDQQYYLTQNEVDATRYLSTVAPSGSLLIVATQNFPAQFHNYEYFTYVSIAIEPETSRTMVLADPAAVLSEWMSNNKYSATYLLITRSQKLEVDTLGIMPVGSLDRIEQALLQSHQFRVIYTNQDGTIFTLANSVDGVTQ
jgi:hypothetical protein